MAFGKQVPDKQVLKSVQQKLVQKAGYGSKVAATIESGTIRLTGVIAQEHLRKQILSSMNGISGVRRVIDTMTVVPPRKRV